MTTLDVYMNGYRVGMFTKAVNGAHLFQYDKLWLNQPGARPISLSLPLRVTPFRGDAVYNFFDNLLPDNTDVRDRIVRRHKANSSQPFDLLSKIGMDSVGALQRVPSDAEVGDIRNIDYKILDEDELGRILTGYKANAPLGMIEEEQDFRISVAGAQEKTALLRYNNRWCLPLHATPTTHIIKLPIGKITGPNYVMDLSDSAENELLCLSLARTFGFRVPDCFMLQAGQVKALAVERFDRRYASDQRWIIRLPQEDFCQSLNVPAARKYESQGGPGIAEIMHVLPSSENAEADRYDFMKAQVFFWLLAATDGHAKNFSVFIMRDGAFCLAPLYDLLSLYPAMGGQGIHIRDAKLAMGLTGKKGKKYHLEQIFPRHFFMTAKAVGFPRTSMEKILIDFAVSSDSVIASVSAALPKTFPAAIHDSILGGLQKRAARLMQGWE